MPGLSPKRKNTSPKKSMDDLKDKNTGSDYRLAIVLGGAIVIAIVIIILIMWTTP